MEQHGIRASTGGDDHTSPPLPRQDMGEATAAQEVHAKKEQT